MKTSHPPLPLLTRPIRENVLLAPYTTWEIGGPADLLAEPAENEVEALLKWACDANMPVRFLGRGSNVLVSDQGVRGLVILTRDSLVRLERHDDVITASSGVSLPRLSKFAAAAGFSGYEFLIGIPGTVGGGVVMNAGLTVFRPRELRDVVIDVTTVSRVGEIRVRTMEELGASYRRTDLQGGQDLVVSVRFQLVESGDPATISARTIEHLRERKGKQPLDKPTAGSTFKSPPGKYSAGWYIEQAGLKGYKVGGAQISLKHANWVENLGGASADDVLRLLDHVERAVVDRFGFVLEREVVCLS